eukprot:6041568-Amphidinium_carterae.1
MKKVGGNVFNKGSLALAARLLFGQNDALVGAKDDATLALTVFSCSLTVLEVSFQVTARKPSRTPNEVPRLKTATDA